MEQLDYALNRMTKANYIRVIVDRAIHRELDYSVPEALAHRIGVGSRVRVPFRDKSALATVVAVLEESKVEGIRPIEAVVGEGPILSEQLLELARWIGVYYCCPIETVMRSMLPQVIRRAEIGWKKQLFVQPGRKIDKNELEKLRKRAPRQAELLEAIAQLEAPMRAAQLLRQTSLDNQTLRGVARGSGGSRPACRRAIHRDVESHSEPGTSACTQGNHASARFT
jgi:primosomal protein N' (replication factor Y) (superfamily II helicase)